MEQSPVDFSLIETFLAVAETGSFTRAAERLKRPKSRVSRHIAQLEADLGLQLIYRTTRQVSLTEAGHRLFKSSSVHVEGLHRALASAAESHNEMSGLIRMTAPEDLSIESLTDLIHEFCQQHPQIHFDLLVTNSLVDLLAEKTDLALRVGRPKDSSFLIRKLGNLQSVLVASPAFVESSGRKITLDSLPQVPCLTFSRTDDHWVLRHPQKGRRKLRIQPVIRCTNHFMLRTLALKGQGVALLPGFLVREALTTGHLVRVMPGWSSETIPLQLLLPPQKNTTLRVRRFADFLVQHLRS